MEVTTDAFFYTDTPQEMRQINVTEAKGRRRKAWSKNEKEISLIWKFLGERARDGPHGETDLSLQCREWMRTLEKGQLQEPFCFLLPRFVLISKDVLEPNPQWGFHRRAPNWCGLPAYYFC
ncbi:uncharacterized protein [Notamacropus eugenii]|uniref:uncharacterized protein isoform X2 n=1 Tax=Notamacropus eugenii TaxID=9315 RepID=UPI003B67838B